MTRAARFLSGALILLAVLGTRAPFFFDYVIDWDESTFILLARSLLQGHLPYTQLWDAKGPIGFAVIAAAMLPAGESIPAVRVAGALLVFVSALLVRALVVKSLGARFGMPSALLFVLGCAATKSGQATMMEHIAVPLLLASVLLLIREPITGVSAFLAGVCVAAAALVRLEVGLVAPLLGLSILVHSWSTRRRPAAVLVTAYALGGFALLLMVALPYWWSGELLTFVGSYFGAAIAHAGSGLSIVDAVVARAETTLGLGRPIRLGNRQFWLALLIWVPAATGTVFCLRRIGWEKSECRLAFMVIGAAMAGVGVALLNTGWFYEHHSLQLLPFAAMLAAVAYQRVAAYGRYAQLAVFGWVAATALLALQDIPRRLLTLIQSERPVATIRGAAGDLEDYLDGRCGDDCSVFLLVDQVGYWLLDKPLPTRIAHPGMLYVPYVYTLPGMRSRSPVEEFTAILASEPTFVVRPQADDSDESHAAADQVLERELTQSYDKVYEYGPARDRREIYRRR